MVTMTTIDPIYRIFARTDMRPFIAVRPTAAIRSLLPIPVLKPAGLMPEPEPEPGLRFEDMEEDINRLAASIAANYTDKSCVFLHTEDLVSEAKVAFVNVLEKDWTNRAKSRGEFFKVLKTAMCNKMRSLVQQHRFTQKRTGVKPPPKHERFVNFESCKPNEISMDDPDSHLQIGEEDQGLHEDDYDTKELIREIKDRLCPFEQMIFQQLVEPSLLSLELAKLDSIRKKKPGAFCKVDITDEHKWKGLGLVHADDKEIPYINQETWEKAVLRIQQVTQQLREMNPDNTRYEMALDSLANLFHLQVPKSTPPMVVRRMFTIAARDNWQKVNPEVEQLLSTVGATAPKFDRDSMRCYGVLYLKGHRLCESCGVKVGCSTQAANIGLGEITIHPKLLGAKLRRTPYVVPTAAQEKPLLTSSMRDNDIVGYLSNHNKFKRITHQGDLFYQPKDFPDKQKMLFCIGQGAIPQLRLRFCNPSPALRKKLIYQNKGYYVSEMLSAQEVIALIDEHTKSAYA